MKETSKAMRRRWCEHETGIYPWREIFKGRMLDVGAGDDPLPFDGVIAFDKEQGDANHLSSYFDSESFDLIHASQVLEHMIDPTLAVRDWAKLLKKGGHLCITVPDLVLYEGMRFPSIRNGDHKSTWSLFYKKSPCQQHIYVPDFTPQFQSDGLKEIFVALLDANLDYSQIHNFDQTLDEFAGVEAFIEILFQKK